MDARDIVSVHSLITISSSTLSLVSSASTLSLVLSASLHNLPPDLVPHLVMLVFLIPPLSPPRICLFIFKYASLISGPDWRELFNQNCLLDRISQPAACTELKVPVSTHVIFTMPTFCTVSKTERPQPY